MGSLVAEIFENQRQRTLAGLASKSIVPPHADDSKILDLACVDARINPLTFTKDGNPAEVSRYKIRNIAARGVGPGGAEGDEEAAWLADAVAAGVTRIRIIGHSCCGGMGKCMCGVNAQGTPLEQYLSSFSDIQRAAVNHSDDTAKNLRYLEAQSVLASAANLKKHKIAQDAKLVIEPYLLDTATGELRDPLKAIAQFSPQEKKPPTHAPKMLIICDWDAETLPQNDLGIGDDRALIFRTQKGGIKGHGQSVPEAAIIEFALSIGVEDIVVLGKEKAGESKESLAAKQLMLRDSRTALKTYPKVQAALENKDPIGIHSWLLDEKNLIHVVNDRGTVSSLSRRNGANNSRADS